MNGVQSCHKDEEQALNTVWTRARVRAYAHRFASLRARKSARLALAIEAVVSAAATSALVGGYFITQSDFLASAGGSTNWKMWGNGLFLASTLLSIFATYMMFTSDRTDLVMLQSRHDVAARMFMNIAQKTRRMEAHVYDAEYYKYLIGSLNEQIEAVITIVESPDDQDYAKAETVFEKVKGHSDPDIRQSFVPGGSD